ncbi:hypothetical protein LTR50_006442 [Elasticomyces elasticus]|nr:hypothetical protein LTR50_006442 [Elasticomyces elasticus]
MPESYELSRTSTSDVPLRPSLEAAYRTSTDSSSSSVADPDILKSRKQRYTDDASEPLTSVSHSEKARPLRRGWRRWFIPSRMCCFMVLLFTAAVALLLSAGGIWVYKEAVPEDGQSPPWYPTPRGGTLQKWSESYSKAADLVRQMSLVEKVNITTGTAWRMGMCVGNTGPVPRLGFPSLCLQDGPLGLRFVDNATAWPAGITVGATWNKELMYQRGKMQGQEARMKGVNVILGPSMGPLGRLPAGGRNWEGFGADPHLQGIAAAKTIQGIQDQGVMATAKHWVGNEQEHFRQSWEWGTPNAISSNIDDRTLHEIYALPFAESVRAGVVSVMCSYNMVNNSYACGNSKLLNGVLKDELGFQGFVQSDWLAQRSGVASALAGLDMSMPGDGLRWEDGKSLWGGELTKAVLNSSLPVERINDMVTRIVAAWYQTGQDDERKWPKEEDGGGPNFSSWTKEKVGLLRPGSDDKTTGVVNKFIYAQGEGADSHGVLARKIAAEGIVLVKNEENILPLSRNGSKATRSERKMRLAIFGEDAYANPKGPNACPDRGCNKGTLAVGWGSGAVEFPYLITPAQALHEAFDDHTVEIADFNTNDPGLGKHPERAADQDLCMVFINADAGEGFIAADGIRGDRNDLYSQKGGDKLVQDVAANCGKVGGNGTAPTIVVLHAVGPVILERWIDYPGVKAVLLAHLPGEESGNALADVIFGDVNPSGRLPYTVAKREEDYGPDSKILYYPNGVVPQQNFTEGLYIDYRYFDKHDISPRYEFGYGLSYTSFKLSSMIVNSGFPSSRPELPAERPQGLEPPTFDVRIPDPKDSVWPAGFRRLKKYVYPYIDAASDIKTGKYPYPPGYSIQQPLSPAGGGEGGNPDLYSTVATVQASLTNLGTRDGSCVVQLYVSYPPNVTDSLGNAVDFPVRQLRAFDKYAVAAGADRQSNRRVKVSLELTRRDLSFWDVGRQNWVLPKGVFEVRLGFSSRDLPLLNTI